MIIIIILSFARPWYFQMITWSSTADHKLWLQEEGGSTLTINNVSVSDSGNYSCQPRDMRPDRVMVTILSERQAPDALQDKTTHTGSAASRTRQNYLGNGTDIRN